jgi:tetratricopeptide (TPR) repeat protein
MVAVAKEISERPTLEELVALNPAIPHLTEAATLQKDWLSDEDLIKPFVGLGRCYEGQGSYHQAEPWHEQCLSIARNYFGEEHPDVTESLNNLALLYDSQGRYDEAEPLYVQALEIAERKLGAIIPALPVFMRIFKSYRTIALPKSR